MAASHFSGPVYSANGFVGAISGVTSQGVTYTPSGTGAVATTVQAKLREAVSVKDFGAVGNGVTDDTAAIQAAIAAINTNGGGSIYFPKGTYLISSLLTVSSNTNLVGETLGTVLKVAAGSVITAMVRVAASSSNVTISSLKFDLNNTLNVIGAWVSGVGINNVTVEDCTFFNSNGVNGHYYIVVNSSTSATTNYTNNIKIIGCNFSSNTVVTTGSIAASSTTLTLAAGTGANIVNGQGVYVVGAQSLTATGYLTATVVSGGGTDTLVLSTPAIASVTNAQVIAGVSGGITCFNGVYNLLIEGNTAGQVVTAFRLNNFLTGCKEVKLKNNTVTSFFNRAIVLEGVLRSVISDNIVSGTYSTGTAITGAPPFGISAQLGCADVLITSNVINAGGEISSYDCTNITITNNRVISSNSAGIEINDGVSGSVSNPTIYNVMVSDNMITGAAASGIFVSAANVLVQGNVIYDCLSNGIKVAEIAIRVNGYNNIVINSGATTVPTTGSINSGTNTLTVASGVGINNGEGITVFGAGSAGTNLNTTVTSGGGTTTLTLAANASTTVSGASVYADYGYSGLRFGNSTDSAPGVTDCTWENNLVADTRTTKLQAYGVQCAGPINNLVLRENVFYPQVESAVYTLFMSGGSTLYLYDNYVGVATLTRSENYETVKVGGGLIVTTPDGTKRYLISVNNSGTLTATLQ
jgi:hypothetical protein